MNKKVMKDQVERLIAENTIQYIPEGQKVQPIEEVPVPETVRYTGNHPRLRPIHQQKGHSREPR